MRIEKRIVNGSEREVQVYGSEQEYRDSEKDCRNMEHADRVASQLAKNPAFIKSLAKELMNMELFS